MQGRRKGPAMPGLSFWPGPRDRHPDLLAVHASMNRVRRPRPASPSIEAAAPSMRTPTIQESNMSSPMPFRRTTLAVTATLLLAGLPAMAQEAQEAMTAAEVRARLEAQGYTKINDVEFKDGVWSADARSADGNRVDLSIDPKTGEIYPDEQVANLGEADVEARLSAAGYAKVHDIEFEDGVWKAEAEDAQGKDVELRLDPATGKVIGKARD